MKRNQRIINIVAICLSIATFTPLVIPYNQVGPKLLGLPYTVWTGFLVSILLVFLTYLASLEGPESGDNDN